MQISRRTDILHKKVSNLSNTGAQTGAKRRRGREETQYPLMSKKRVDMCTYYFIKSFVYSSQNCVLSAIPVPQ